METIEINDLSSLGAISGVPPYMLPPEAWTLALNMRYRDKGVESLLGWEGIFGVPPEGPHFLLPMSTPAGNFWIYTSLLRVYIYDGAAHSDITRLAGSHATTDTWQWNATILGGIPYLNNGIDVPQYRPDMALVTKFANLLNWPVNLRARTLRALSPYMMAFGLTDTGVSLPHTIHWSHPADPGAIPSSWDYTNPAVDAGRKDLDDVNSGIILDALPLASSMFIYKENSTWRATPIGGRFIFDWKTVFENTGILAPRCVALVGDAKRHCVVTQDDMVWHNGQRMVSILDKRQRTALFSEIDSVSYGNSFLFANPLYNEMWFCYPTSGNVYPNKALIWNYVEGDADLGAISFADGITFRNAAIGNIQGDPDELWSQGTDGWDEDTGSWSDFARRRLVTAGTSAVKFYNMDRGSTRDGAQFQTLLAREALALLGRKRTGAWIVDHRQKKMFSRIWPKVQGGPINIRVGSSQVVNGPTAWGTPMPFDPLTQMYPDIEPVEGRALSLELSTATALTWRIDGYQFDVARLGQF